MPNCLARYASGAEPLKRPAANDVSINCSCQDGFGNKTLAFWGVLVAQFRFHLAAVS